MEVTPEIKDGLEVVATGNPLEGREVDIVTNGSNVDLTTTDGSTEEVVEGSEETLLDAEGNPIETPADEDPEEEAVELDPVQVAVDKQVKAGEALEKDLTAKGIDFKALEDEYATTGVISEKSREALEKVGYPAEIVDMFLNNLGNAQEQLKTKVHQLAGGEKEYPAIISHIQAMGKAHVDAYNKAINSGDLTTIAMLLNGVKASMVKKHGSKSPTVLGAGGAESAPLGYQSIKEMTQAMNDKRYGKDPAYTAKVEAMVTSSKLF